MPKDNNWRGDGHQGHGQQETVISDLFDTGWGKAPDQNWT